MISRIFAAGFAILVGGCCLVLSGCGSYGFAQDEAGSTIESGSRLIRSPRRDSRSDFLLEPVRRSGEGAGIAGQAGSLPRGEAGSLLDARPDDPFPEARSLLSPQPRPAESGSALGGRRLPGRFESGSGLPWPSESGSVLHGRESGSVLRRTESGPVIRRDAASPAPARAATEYLVVPPSAAGGSESDGPRPKRLTPLALVLVAVAGAALVLFAMFKLGMSNPYARELWSRRLDLCGEVAQHLSRFMDAARREEWDAAQAALDRVHATNGRRAVLLGNQANAAVFRFLQLAVNCRLSGRDTEFRRNLDSRFALAIESLRKATRQSEFLSMEVRQQLVEAHRTYRTLRERG